jgi:calcineurin-like phosphoesterase
MRLPFVADVVGPRAVEWLAELLRERRRDSAAALVVVDAENCAPA